MITRGIVEKIVNRYAIKVRIPLLHNASNSTTHTDTENLAAATICATPRCDFNVQVGDVVYVGFENEDYSKPVILGYLYGANVGKITPVQQSLQSIDIEGITKLSAATYIGNIGPDNIKILATLQEQLDDINNKIDLIAKKINLDLRSSK